MTVAFVLAAVGLVLLFLAIGIFSGGNGRRINRIACILLSHSVIFLLGSLEYFCVDAGAAWWKFPALVGGIAAVFSLLPLGMWLGRRLGGPR